MKYLYLLLVIIATPTVINAQDSTIALSKYERYCSEPGKLLKTFTLYIGEVRSAQVEILKTNDIQKGDTVSVVRITSIGWGATPLISASNFYFEKEQLDTVINVLQYYAAELKKEDVKNFAYSYLTENDISINCAYQEGFFSNTWLTIRKVYKYLRTPLPASFSFTKKDVDVLITVLQTAQRHL